MRSLGRQSGNAIPVASSELRMCGEHLIGEQIAQLRLRPALHDELRNEVQVGAWGHVVRNTRGDDRQNGSRALATFIEPGNSQFRLPSTNLRSSRSRLLFVSSRLLSSKKSRSRCHCLCRYPSALPSGSWAERCRGVRRAKLEGHRVLDDFVLVVEYDVAWCRRHRERSSARSRRDAR